MYGENIVWKERNWGAGIKNNSNNELLSWNQEWTFLVCVIYSYLPHKILLNHSYSYQYLAQTTLPWLFFIQKHFELKSSNTLNKHKDLIHPSPTIDENALNLRSKVWCDQNTIVNIHNPDDNFIHVDFGLVAPIASVPSATIVFLPPLPARINEPIAWWSIQ